MKRTIVDTAGRTVTLDRPVNRMVLLSTVAARAVQILGADESVVGINETIREYPFYFPVIAQSSSVGTWKTVDWEKVAALEPDLVVAYAYAPGPINVAVADEQLKKFKIPVVGLNLYLSDQYEQIFTEFGTLAHLLGREVAAQRYIDWSISYQNRVRDFVKGKNRPNVFLTRTSGAIGRRERIRVYGRSANLTLLCAKAGGRPILVDTSARYPQVTADQVAKENPDAIIMSGAHTFSWWESSKEPKELIAQLLDGKGWEKLRATINKKIYAVPYSAICGLEHVYGQVLLTKLLFPEFDLSPSAVYKEFLEIFLRIDYPEGEGKVLAYSDSTTLTT